MFPGSVFTLALGADVALHRVPVVPAPPHLFHQHEFALARARAEFAEQAYAAARDDRLHRRADDLRREHVVGHPPHVRRRLFEALRFHLGIVEKVSGGDAQCPSRDMGPAGTVDCTCRE